MKAHFTELIGLEFDEVKPGSTVCRLTVRDDLKNRQNAVHGAVVYALADTGMGAATYWTLNEGEMTATVEIKVSYFKAVFEGEIECRTELVNRGKRIASLESEIFNEGRLVAKAYGTYAIWVPGARSGSE